MEKFSTGYKEGVAGIAWCEERIYVIHWLSNMISVFNALAPFEKFEAETITIGLEKLRDPYDMHISESRKEIIIGEYQHKKIWKISLPNKHTSVHPIDVRPRGMSLTSSDELLVAVWKDHPPTRYFLDIYALDDVTRRERMSPPSGVARIDHAVKSLYGSYIVSHARKDAVYVISEMSRFGENLMINRTFVPPEELETWFPFHMTTDEDGRIFICDYSPMGKRVFVIYPGMTRMEVLLNAEQHQVAMPARICYLPKKHQLLLGQGRSSSDSSGYPSSVAIFDLLPTKIST